jgi:hypothetical protein
MNNQIPKIVFIVPYRDRKYEKVHFTIYMKYIMEDYNKSDYEIYFSHQKDNRPFNRGAMKNIGFLAIKDKYPLNYQNITFVFNDIDTLPSIKNLLNYETISGEVKHFYGFKFALGGIFSIKGCDFEKINGFTNNWGWGLEDNIIQKNILNNNLKINRDNFFYLNSKEIIHLYDSPERLINNDDIKKYNNKIYLDALNKITNLEYEIINNLENMNNNQDNIFMININKFNTLYNFNEKSFYLQNMKEKSMLNTKNIGVGLKMKLY